MSADLVKRLREMGSARGPLSFVDGLTVNAAADRIAELEAGLKPFADSAEHINSALSTACNLWPQDGVLTPFPSGQSRAVCNVSDLRRAASLLGAKP